MAFRGQDNASLMLIRQMIDHENSAKKNFDYFTGANSSQKFYQGRINELVEDKANTWLKDQTQLQQSRFGYKSPEAKSSKNFQLQDNDVMSHTSKVSRVSHRSSVANDRESMIAAAMKLPMASVIEDAGSKQKRILHLDEECQTQRLLETLGSAKLHIYPGMHETKSMKSYVKPNKPADPKHEVYNLPDQHKHLTVFGRQNKKVEPYQEFQPNGYSKVFNADRMQGMTAKDAMVDPHQTMQSPAKQKDQGYYELNKRNSLKHDLKSKVIQDYTGNPIIKIDSIHGQRNGNLWGQMTHANLCGEDRPNMRQTFGKDSPQATLQAMRRFNNVGQAIATPSRTSRSVVSPSQFSHTPSELSQLQAGAATDTEKQLLARKLYLMRKMLKNERRANDIISTKLTDMIHGTHGNNPANRLIQENILANDRGVIKQHMD